MAWETKRVKDVIQLKARIGWKGLRSDEFQTYSYAYLITGQDFNSAKINLSGCYQIDKDRYEEDPYIQLNEGDVLVTKDGTIGKVAMVTNLDKPACLNSGVFVLHQKKNYFVQKYLFWQLSSSVFKEFIKENSDGSTIQHLYQNVFDLMKLILPPESTQQKIADFLDAKTQNIDARIELLEKKKEHYIILRKALINESVNGEGKGWKKVRMKDVFSFTKGLSITKENLEESGIPVISYGQIHSKQNKGVQIDDSLIRFVNESYLETGKKALTEQYDFIFADTSEDLVGCGNNVYVDRDMTLFAGYHTIILRNKKHQDNKFLAYLFLSDNWRTQIRKSVCGIKVFSITQKDLAPVEIVLPSYEEQVTISKYLDKKTSAIDSIVSNITKEIDSLKTYRRALINEAVTGKLGIE